MNTSPQADIGTIDRTLIAFAFLAQTSRDENDLLLGLAPLFKPIAKEKVGHVFEPDEVAAALQKYYGFKIHPWTVENFAPRLEHAGIITRISLPGDAHRYIYAPVQEEIAVLSVSDIASLIGRFCAFAKPLLAEHRLEATDQELESALLEQLIDLDFISVLLAPEKPILREGARKLLSIKKASEQLEWEKRTEQKARFDVLCASFILHAHRAEPDVYNLLVRVVSGALVSQVVLEFQEPPATSDLTGLTIVLDAPFVMSLLDLHSQDRTKFARSLCEQLQQKSAVLATFRHCVDELQEVLKGEINSYRNGSGSGITAARLHSAPFEKYANLVAQGPDGFLERESIQIIEIGELSGLYQHFTDEDERNVYDALGPFSNPRAQQRDAASVANILRLRRGKQARMSRFGTAGFVFVTENPLVVNRSCRHLDKKGLYRKGDVSPAITDRYLAGLMWVLYGGKGVELPPRLLLANCAAALSPRSDVIRQMHDFLRSMSDHQAEHFHALMTVERAGQHLMQLTLGDSRFLTRDNVAAVLDQIKDTLLEEHDQKTRQEIAGIEEGHRVELEAAHGGRKSAERLLQEATAEARQARQALQAQRAAAFNDRLARVGVCAIGAARFRRRLHIAFACAIAAVGAGAAYYYPETVAGRVAAALVMGTVALVTGWKIPEYYLESWFDRMALGWFESRCHDAMLYGVERDFDIDLRNGLVSVRPAERLLSSAVDASSDPV